MEISILNGDAMNLFTPRLRNKDIAPKLIKTPLAPTMRNLIKMLHWSKRIDQIRNRNSVISLKPNFDSPEIRSTK